MIFFHIFVLSGKKKKSCFLRFSGFPILYLISVIFHVFHIAENLPLYVLLHSESTKFICLKIIMIYQLIWPLRTRTVRPEGFFFFFYFGDSSWLGICSVVTLFVPVPDHAPITTHQRHFQFKICGTMGVFRNTLVGGLGKMEGGTKSFESSKRWGDKKFLTNKERGAKKVTKIDSIYLEISKFLRATQAL